MGTRYSATSVSGYNSSPPSDDGSTAASNQGFWSTIKTKLGDPLNTFASALDGKLATAFDYSARSITTSDSTVAGDHMKTVQIASTVSTAITVSLGDATSMAAGYIVTVSNQSAISQTVGRVTSSNGINGTAANVTLPALCSLTFKVNAAATGYNIEGQSNNASFTSSVLRSYLAGLTLSTAGSSATMSIAAGQATDSTNAVSMSIAAFSKTTSAFSAGTGNGGLDTGAIANSTWYHFYLIAKVDGTADILISLSASSPTMPSGYTYYRRIGSGKTNGSAQWVSFTQDGDYFRLAASVQDVGTTNPGTSAVTATLASVPTGVNVHAIFNIFCDVGTSTSVMYYVSDLAANDEAPSKTGVPGTSLSSGGNGSKTAGGQIQIRTNTSAQIRYRLDLSGASDKTFIITLGWIDYRGRNA